LGQPVRVILTAQIRAPAHAGAQLRRGNGIRAVIRFKPHNTTVAHMGDQQTASAAVMGGAAYTDPLF
jgi:hypothetical protein